MHLIKTVRDYRRFSFSEHTAKSFQTELCGRYSNVSLGESCIRALGFAVFWSLQKLQKVFLTKLKENDF